MSLLLAIIAGALLMASALAGGNLAAKAILIFAASAVVAVL
jgi:hypothetical protein